MKQTESTVEVPSKRHTYSLFSPMKFLLIMGVVLIHCSIIPKYGRNPEYITPGTLLVGYISDNLMSVSVPCFFIISGFLYFNGVKSFSMRLYTGKLRRRVTTLLVPYVIWNIICGLLLIVKARYLGMSGLGIVMPDGGINWKEFLYGFWAIPEAEYCPLAFAFWYIRNLMVFCVLSPLAWILGRRIWTNVILFCVGVIPGVYLYGFEWFVLGCCMACNGFCFKRNGKYIVMAAALIWALFAYFKFAGAGVMLWPVMVVMVTSAFVVIYNLAIRMERLERYPFTVSLIGSTFFIYAFHQTFTSITVKLWVGMIGFSSIPSSLAVLVMSFVTMVSVSYLLYLLGMRLCPAVMRVITGGRD